MINLTMTSDRCGVSATGIPIPIGTIVEYVCHVSGGMFTVRMPNGDELIVHPHIFPTLRDDRKAYQ